MTILVCGGKRPFSVKRFLPLFEDNVCLLLRLRDHTQIVDIHAVRLSAFVSTQHQILRFVIKRGETGHRRGVRRDGLCHALSKIQGPRTSHGQHRPRKKYQRFTFKHNFATILQQSAAFNTDLFRCHRDHSGINMLWKQSLMSVIPNQAAGIISGPTSNFEKPSLERRFTFGHGRKRRLLLRASTMSLCFRPSSLRTAKRPTFSLGSRMNRTINAEPTSEPVRDMCVVGAPAPGQNTAQGR